MKLELIFCTDFWKVHKFKISRKSVQLEPSCSMRTDGHDEANSRSSQFCESAKNIGKQVTTPWYKAFYKIVHPY
jgi:hypothetical protein